MVAGRMFPPLLVEPDGGSEPVLQVRLVRVHRISPGLRRDTAGSSAAVSTKLLHQSSERSIQIKHESNRKIYIGEHSFALSIFCIRPSGQYGSRWVSLLQDQL